jgi:SAM-dependent methyltransferase
MLDILRTVKSLVFGRARRCPVCERNAVSFLPLPDYYREQADKYGYKYFGKGETINIKEYSCNHCGASDRERLSALFLESVIRREGFVSGSKLLHFAPEVALAKRIRQSGKFDYRSADISMEGVSDNVDITDMACYGDAVFDAFICSHVLEHVQDDHAALCELHRILKPGGLGDSDVTPDDGVRGVSGGPGRYGRSGSMAFVWSGRSCAAVCQKGFFKANHSGGVFGKTAWNGLFWKRDFSPVRDNAQQCFVRG